MDTTTNKIFEHALGVSCITIFCLAIYAFLVIYLCNKFPGDCGIILFVFFLLPILIIGLILI